MQLIESMQKTLRLKSIALLIGSSLFMVTTASRADDDVSKPATDQAASLGGDQDDAITESTDSKNSDEVIDEFGAFEIAVEDVPLPQVLNMLAIQSRRNIIMSKRVGSVSISANLFDVTFYEALDSILHIASLCYDEQGNFIYVMTCEEKLQRERAGRKIADRVYYLDHISPADAESLAKPLLSSEGTMSKLGDAQNGFAPGKTDAGSDDWAHEPVLVVRDYTDNLDAINALLKDVDTPPKQVMVESTILVTKSEGDYAWGMDVSVLLKANFQQLINPLNPVGWLQNDNPAVAGAQAPTNNAIGIQSTVGNTQGAGGFKFGILNDNVGVFLRLLDDVSDTMILARPKILALNRQRAQVLVGERIAYLSTTQTETATTQSVQFLDTGINLILRPFISRDNSIRMELYPSVSEYKLRTIGDGATLGFTTVPDEITNEITTNVRVRDGETVILGGLFKDKAVTSRKSVPGLGDVPVLGAAFQGQDDKVERQEIIFLVTPTVVQEEVMDNASREANELVSDISVGVREGLLPWAREKMAANYNHDAHAALSTGDTDRAISFINRSLRNDPNQPAMVKMRTEILGDRSIYSTNLDVLDQIFERTFRRSVGESDENEVFPTSDPLSSAAPSVKDATMTQFDSDHFVGGDPFAVATSVPALDSSSPEITESAPLESNASTGLITTEPSLETTKSPSDTALAIASDTGMDESSPTAATESFLDSTNSPRTAESAEMRATSIAAPVEVADPSVGASTEIQLADAMGEAPAQAIASADVDSASEAVLFSSETSETAAATDASQSDSSAPNQLEAVETPVGVGTDVAGFNTFTQTKFRTAFMKWWMEYLATAPTSSADDAIATAEEDLLKLTVRIWRNGRVRHQITHPGPSASSDASVLLLHHSWWKEH
jgi:type IV pilus assembly protein PilQ